MEFIDIKHQYRLYKKEIDTAIGNVLESGHFIMGKEIEQLEMKLAEFVGVDHCISVSSGTDSLWIALMALGIGPGCEVITTPFTWISSSEVIALVGATPIFVDIDPITYNIDIEKLESAITPKTAAILSVSLFGQMPNYQKMNQIAEKYNLPIIEDGAQSFGATQFGKKSCGVTTIGSTSFFPAKPLGCYGDGGAIFTNDLHLAKKMRAIRTYGGTTRFEYDILGINGRLDTIQAAVLLAKLPYFPSEVIAREKIGKRYNELLEGFFITPRIEEGNTHVFAQYTIRVQERELFIQSLATHGIPTGIYYPKCMHEYVMFAGSNARYTDLPHAEKASKGVVSLPMHPWLTEDEQNFIVHVAKQHVMVHA